jgi:hypothetical protein
MCSTPRVSYGRDMVDVHAKARALKFHLSPRLPGFTAGNFASSGGRSLAS